MSSLLAVILCGGKGSRISKYTKITPKPIIKIKKNKNFLDYILKNISRFKINKIILLCCYKKDLFFKKYHNKKVNGTKIICIDEKTPKGTGGSLLSIKKYKSDFFLFNGDTYLDINFLELKKQLLNKRNKIINIALCKAIGKRYLNLNTNKNNEIYLQKNSNIINGGIYYIKRKFFKNLNKGYSSLENDILPRLIDKKKVIGNKFINNNNKFIDIGTYHDLERSKKIVPKLDQKKAVFLDRDGVINYDDKYVYLKRKFRWKKNVFESIKLLNDNNFYVFIVTNQSGVGRGYYDETAVLTLHNWINKELIKVSAHIDDFFYAPYFKSSKKKKYRLKKNLRKPDIGMYQLAMKKWNFNKKSYMIGDQTSDYVFAKNCNLKFYLCKNDNLLEIVKKIIN